MRKVLLFFIALLPYIAHAQKFDFPRNSRGKIEYKSRAFNFERSFKLSAKRALANYADYFNGAVTFGNERMHDYISYEDDSTIVASVKFYVRQALRLNVFSAEVEFDEIYGIQYMFKITKIRLMQVYNTWSDYPQQNVVIDMDNLNISTHQALCKHLDQELLHFATFFND